MSTPTEEPTEQPIDKASEETMRQPTPRVPEPPQIGAITGLGAVGAIGLIGGLILIAVAFGIGDSADLSVSDLSGRMVVASIAGAAITAGFFSSIAAGLLIGLRELMRRYRDRQPF